MRVLVDWDCHLMPMMRELIANPKDTVRTLCFLRDRFELQRFYMMPEYDCRLESVSLFLLKREKSKRELNTILPQEFKLQYGATSLLFPGLFEQEGIHKLLIPKTAYLPIRLPLKAEESWVAVELNRLLYHVPYRILFMSFDRYRFYYPTDTVDRLLQLPKVAYQFSYQSLINEETRADLKTLIRRNAPIVFGTGLTSYGQACYYELDYYLKLAKQYFSEYEMDMLFFNKRIYRPK